MWLADSIMTTFPPLCAARAIPNLKIHYFKDEHKTKTKTFSFSFSLFLYLYHQKIWSTTSNYNAKILNQILLKKSQTKLSKQNPFYIKSCKAIKSLPLYFGLNFGFWKLWVIWRDKEKDFSFSFSFFERLWHPNLELDPLSHLFKPL